DGLADVIDGGDGDDLLFGDGGNDTLSGGAGHDTLIGEAGDDSLDGGEGYDHAFFDNVSAGITATFSAVTTVTGDAGIGTDTLVDVEKIRGSEFNDTLTADGTYSGTYGDFNVFEGGDGDDSITGNGNTRVEYLNADGGVVVDLVAGTANAGGLGATNVGSDTLVGGINRIAGSHFGDSLTGGADDDMESFRGMDGNDTIDGSTGYDESDYWLSSEGITAIMTAGSAGTVSKASGELDTLISIEKIRGSEFGDTFDSTAFVGVQYESFNAFEGLGGNDTVLGNNETRIEYREADGGVHVDLASGFSQGMAGIGGATNVGNDTISGVNSIIGSSHDDSLVGGAIDDYEEYRPGAGDDTIDGGTGFDRLRYTHSDSAITMEFSDVTDESGTVSIDGFGGSDVFTNIDEVQGSSFGDSMTGNSQTDRFIGGAGDDTIDGGSNYDLARYDRSDQTFGVHVDLFDGFAHNDGYGDTDSLVGIEEIRGGSMNDSLYGSAEYEKFMGNGGDDDLQGRDGRDTLEGGDGNDTLSGGDDWDTLEGGDGVDSLDGGAGSDWLNGGAGDDFIDGGADSDGVNYYSETVGINVSMSSAGAGTVTHDGYTDTLINIERIHGSSHADFFTGSSDADRFYGEDGNDTMDGGAGDDFMQAGDGANSLEGGLGNDTADYYSVSTGVTVVMTGGGAGTVVHDGDTDTLGGIEYVGGSYADDSLTGSADVDSFTGHLGNDTLVGGGGDDWLYGGAGQDVMTGGTGIDEFYIGAVEDATIVALNAVFTDSSDVITDFVSATDVIFLQSNFVFSGSYDAADDFLTTIGGSAYDGTNADYTGGQDTGEAKLIFDGSYLYFDDNESTDGYTVIAEFTSGTIVGTDVSAT
ncbi:MAG: calcium-binding protein, partial [Sneathiella sp.]